MEQASAKHVLVRLLWLQFFEAYPGGLLNLSRQEDISTGMLVFDHKDTEEVLDQDDKLISMYPER